MFIILDKTLKCDRRTDRQTEFPQLVQQSALRAMWTRCKNETEEWMTQPNMVQYSGYHLLLSSGTTDCHLYVGKLDQDAGC